MNLSSQSTSNAPAIRPGRWTTAGLAVAISFLTACGQSAPPASEPTPTPAATPTVTPVAAAVPASPTPEVAKYNGQQQMEYNRQAVDAFVTQRAEKSQPYIEAHNALETAGSVGAKGLTSREVIAARRDLIAKCIAANDVYLDFVKTQENTYRAELAKTPLLPGDVDSLASDFATRANTAAIVKLRETERETLKAGDEMLSSLDKSYGDWSVNGAGALTFKKKGASAPYSVAAQKYNKLANDEVKMLAEVNKSQTVPSASATPAAAPGASAAPAASTAPASAAKPTP